MKILYCCTVCHTMYLTEAMARQCETFPVSNPYNIKIGDEIIITRKNSPYQGKRGIVDRVDILADYNSSKHILNLKVRVGEEGFDSETVNVYINEYIPFIEGSLPMIADKLGEAVHNLWVAKCKTERHWHSPEECPAKNHDKTDCSLCHVSMRPYAELLDNEKELDRAYPREFIRILDELGYMITRKPKS